MIKLSSNIIKYINSIYGETDSNNYFDFVLTNPVTYIRKKKKINEGKLSDKLGEIKIKLEKINGIENAFKVNSGSDSIGKTLEFMLGQYYIQSLSSMLPALILNPEENDKVLDLCSAPGSKTTQIADLMNNHGILISNELKVDRIKMLVHNIDRMNIINAGVLQGRGEWLNNYYQNYFDKILVDAPCSALGVVQKKGEVSNWWSFERLANLTKIQLMLISSAVKMVKKGGEIVYSTCTLTIEENELLIDYILNKFPLQVIEINLPVKSREAFTFYKGKNLNKEIKKARRILPWEVNSDGFFIIKLKKTDETNSSLNKRLKIPNVKILSPNEIVTFLDNISDSFKIRKNIWEDFRFLLKYNDLFFFNKDWSDPNPEIFTRIGTRFGIVDNKKVAHLHSFAAQFLEDEIHENIHYLSNEIQLKEYLSGNILRTGFGLKGQKVIKYKEYVLGTGVQTENGLKSQFPKSKRMNEIKIK